MRTRLALPVTVTAAFVATTVFAQSGRTSAALALAEGAVYLDDRPIDAASLPSVLPDTAVLRTAKGRAAVALKRGGWLFLDAGASVNVVGNAGYDFNRIAVLSGSVIIASGTSAPVVECENEVRLSTAGMFRVDIRPMDAGDERSCQVRVYDGAATVRLATVTNALRTGEAMACNRRCGDMIPTTEFSPDQLDEFDRWARRSYEGLNR